MGHSFSVLSIILASASPEMILLGLHQARFPDWSKRTLSLDGTSREHLLSSRLESGLSRIYDFR